MENIYRNPNWRNLTEILPGDLDFFAYDERGNLLQKKVSFRDGRSSVSWEPIQVSANETLFCQAPSATFAAEIEDHFDDPRSAMSDPEVWRRFGGHPDERTRY